MVSASLHQALHVQGVGLRTTPRTPCVRKSRMAPLASFLYFIPIVQHAPHSGLHTVARSKTVIAASMVTPTAKFGCILRHWFAPADSPGILWESLSECQPNSYPQELRAWYVFGLCRRQRCRLACCSWHLGTIVGRIHKGGLPYYATGLTTNVQACMLLLEP